MEKTIFIGMPFLKNKQAEIWILDCTSKVSEYYFQLLLPYIKPEKQRRIQAYRKKCDALLSLWEEVLLRIAVSSVVNIKATDLCFIHNSYGKPELKNQDVHFNGSHSGGWVVVGISTYPIGVDVEVIDTIEYEEIINNYFHPREKEFLVPLTQETRLYEFFRYWTMKESYLKAIGTGLYKDLNTFYIEPSKDDIFRVVDGIPIETQIQSWMLEGNHWLSYCIMNSELTVTSKNISCEEAYLRYTKPLSTL